MCGGIPGSPRSLEPAPSPMKTSTAPQSLALLVSAFASLLSPLRDSLRLAVSLCSAVICHSSFVIAQGGSLTPPGAPAPTMKTLDQMEPRTPISALPFTISVGGSYYVTGNLSPTVLATGITVSASHVTIDLGGFQLAGNGGSNLSGVRIQAGQSNITIRNGIVRNWSGSGISAADLAVAGVRVENVRALNNGVQGIGLGAGCAVVDCLASGNASDGIATGTDGLVLRCTSRGNTGIGEGIETGARSVVRECVATGNGGDGINVGNQCVIENCGANGNTGDGIAGAVALVVQACTASDNTDAGIRHGSGSTVTGCSVESNSGASALVVGNNSTVAQCTLRNNTSNAATSQAISAAAGSTVVECSVGQTQSTAATLTASTGMGIAVGSDCLVERCNLTSSAGDGIRAGGTCRIVGNLVSGSGSTATTDGAGINLTVGGNYIDGNIVNAADRGIQVSGTDSILVRNRVRNTPANYVVGVNNSLGAIVVPGNNAAINGNGAVASSLGTTDPWANFSE